MRPNTGPSEEQTKLKAVKTELRRRLRDPIPAVGTWLRAVVGGHIRYDGVPTNGPALQFFRSGGPSRVSHAVATKPERPRPLEPDAAAHRPLVASCPRLSSVPFAPAWRHHMGDHDSYSDSA